MKKFIALAAIAAAAFTTPAMARDFSGPRVEVTVGADDVVRGADPTDITYGAGIGYDLQIGKVVVGAEATAANVFDRADLGVAGRLGYVVSDNVLVYTRAGYTNLQRPAVRGRSVSLDGATVGAGVEVNVSGPFYGKVEYRYTDFSKSRIARHGALVGVGVRF